MKILLILGHPKSGSFNHVLAETAVQTLGELGHEVLFHDLYRERFDPVLPVDEEKLDESELPEYLRQYLSELRESQGLIFVHPNWWGGTPAILRGWIDRVFRQNSVYNFTPNGPVSYIGNKIVQVFSTSNTPRDIEVNVYGDPVETFWRVILFGLLGSQSFERRNFESIILSTPEERRLWIDEVKTTLRRRFMVL
ncbi:MAG: NAD(P)H-dependent oxidoreductase [Planctomycetaceae bacterium]|jgi:putative NADPH-quinone reductase|nr:NAD(P)H-dependent oxidoreductase [Planctomycetaceae bacterium]